MRREYLLNSRSPLAIRYIPFFSWDHNQKRKPLSYKPITISATRFFKMFRLTRRLNNSLTKSSNIWVENMLFDWAIDLALAYGHMCRDILCRICLTQPSITTLLDATLKNMSSLCI